ncbi:dihydrolipoamide acetyltransferase family protein [Paenarthrobacter nicotinovorans]|uniref:dihydrolipoamide acetyltransferase family protein n=1 Tax=Paenarthrobacter nicotinovorans TaxID=29320 RepID=UPI0024864AD0|nr:dihydrolipoamide acetyltransferase family protein [Paenarthrobacter nicotinovorans]MDI2020122.1 Dihydrolipoyllysine-residue acetyltransferase component of pyruvate dehydrogenase complex [Paenarthrobacter nicotinovorans]
MSTIIKEFLLPDLGEGLTESEILDWKVSVGDTVELNQIIAEVETAKAVVELPSPYAGVISELHEEPGTVVAVGTRIISFELPAEKNTTPDQRVAETSLKVDGEPPKRIPTLVGYGTEVEKSGRPQRRPRSVARVSAAQPLTASAVPLAAPKAGLENTRVRSTPPVRKLARDLGVDLGTLTGTGARGVVTRLDVLAAAKKPDTASPDVSLAGEAASETRTPIKGVRKHTAAAMVASAFTAPHVTEFLTIDVTAMMELLAQLKKRREFNGYKLTPLTLVAKALCIAVARQPSLNSRWDEENAEIVTMNYVNLGIAAATPRGLMVPNIKNAQTLNLLQLSSAITELTERARGGKTVPNELSAGTISITNIGVFGIDAGTPILNPGEAAILAMGAVCRRPWEHNGEVTLRDVMTLSLSFDHRLVDGEQGSRFLADIGAVLSQPGMTLALL